MNSESNKRTNLDSNRSKSNSKKDTYVKVKCVHLNAGSIVNKQKELNLLVV